LAEIIETARRIGARAIFAETQFSPKVAETIAAESGAQVLFLNPLGGALRPASGDASYGPTGYVEMMRYNVAQMERGMKNGE
jgi:zinc transport system substrate-binding protein